jgi:proteasome accessory factor A
VSHDPTLRHAVDLEDGTTATALELQWLYLEWVRKYAREVELDAATGDAIDAWEDILTDLERDPLSTADRLDWTAKLQLLLDYRERDGLAGDDPKLRLIDLQYHDVDPDKGLYFRLAKRGRIRRLFSDAAVTHAVEHPPERTRAYFRGRCVDRFGEALVSANWDSLVLETGEESLQRVPMMEPLRGTKDLVADLIDGSEDAAALVRKLRGNDG